MDSGPTRTGVLGGVISAALLLARPSKFELDWYIVVVERTVASRAAPTNVARTRRGQEMSKERERRGERRKAFNEGSTKI